MVCDLGRYGFPTTRGLGLNSFDILLPIPGWATPNFRAFSTGGVDQNGGEVSRLRHQHRLAAGGGDVGAEAVADGTCAAARCTANGVA